MNTDCSALDHYPSSLREPYQATTVPHNSSGLVPSCWRRRLCYLTKSKRCLLQCYLLLHLYWAAQFWMPVGAAFWTKTIPEGSKKQCYPKLMSVFHFSSSDTFLLWKGPKFNCWLNIFSLVLAATVHCPWDRGLRNIAQGSHAIASSMLVIAIWDKWWEGSESGKQPYSFRDVKDISFA